MRATTQDNRSLHTLGSESVCVSFGDNTLLTALYGENDSNLEKIEKALKIEASSRGGVVALTGKKEAIANAEKILLALYHQLENGYEIDAKAVEATITMVTENKKEKTCDNTSELFEEEIIIKTPKKHIIPYSQHQKEYVKSLFNGKMTFAIGPAGTGKTYLAAAVAVSLFVERKIDKIILSRPAVEAGEKIGFLPGDMKEKVDPYLRPLYDALHEMMPAEKVNKCIENNSIEIAPLAFMRGRTLNDAFIILDEAQNASEIQMKMFLTRLGQNSRMSINGDLTQIDLEKNEKSGLVDAIKKLKTIKEISIVEFTRKDVLRDSLVTKILKAYEE